MKDLNERNQAELKRNGFKDDTFKFVAESEAGNHLMKTIVFNQFVEKHNTNGMFIALRWDEQPARKNDEYFTEKEGATKVMASLARDLIAGRPTERESVFGFAVREGEAKNLPMTFTKYVYALTTASEQNLE